VVLVAVAGFVSWLLAGAAAAAVPATTPQTLSPSYEAVVRRYAVGDHEGALSEACSWPEARLKREVPIRKGDWQRAEQLGAGMSPELWRVLPAKAGLMLHTDCARRARGGGWPSGLHEAAAWSIARVLEADPEQKAFARRWYETFAELALADFRFAHALAWVERGLKDFPDSAEMLLVMGAIEEIQATEPERADARPYLEAARRTLRAAVAADPRLAEAELRLGRVAYRLGATDEARAALVQALERSGGGRTAFLAHLFAGRIDEDAGRLQAAAASYAAAVAIDPRCQSGRLALSHVRLRLGDEAAARRDVEDSLESAGGRPRDPLWLYPWGPSVGVLERLEALRREASEPWARSASWSPRRFRSSSRSRRPSRPRSKPSTSTCS
jgi:tetratricopeptide (TPR) repeat protein